ncbi:MAG: hypothetical protein ABEK02_06470 [Haloquadratum sp.]
MSLETVAPAVLGVAIFAVLAFHERIVDVLVGVNREGDALDREYRP